MKDRIEREKELQAFAQESGFITERPTVKAEILSVSTHKKGGEKVIFKGTPTCLNTLKAAAEDTFGHTTSAGSIGSNAFVVVHTGRGRQGPQIGKVVLGS